MSKRRTRQVIRVVVVSPGDVATERDALGRQVEELNLDFRDDGLLIELWTWEIESGPGLHAHGAQGLIDEEMRIADADIVVGIFWKRFGTPVADAGSGTAHELGMAWESWREQGRPDVMMYFCERPFWPGPSEIDQLRDVIKFRERLLPEQAYSSYVDVEQFAHSVRQHLKRKVREHTRPQRSADPFAAIRGHLRLRIGDCDATFEDGTKILDVRDTTSVTLGSASGDGVLTLHGSAAVGVSGRHLRLSAFGQGWSFTDLNSRNHTYEAHEGQWVRIAPQASIPLNHKSQLCLGDNLLMNVEVVRPARDPLGGTPAQTGQVLGARRLGPVGLEAVALALLAPRRRHFDTARSATIEDIASTVSRPAREIEADLRAIENLPEVRSFLGGDVRLADALSLAYPYLAAAADADGSSRDGNAV